MRQHILCIHQGILTALCSIWLLEDQLFAEWGRTNWTQELWIVLGLVHQGQKYMCVWLIRMYTCILSCMALSYYKFSSVLTEISYFLSLLTYIQEQWEPLTVHTSSAQLPLLSGSVSLHSVSYMKTFTLPLALWDTHARDTSFICSVLPLLKGFSVFLLVFVLG